MEISLLKTRVKTRGTKSESQMIEKHSTQEKKVDL